MPALLLRLYMVYIFAESMMRKLDLSVQRRKTLVGHASEWELFIRFPETAEGINNIFTVSLHTMLNSREFYPTQFSIRKMIPLVVATMTAQTQSRQLRQLYIIMLEC